MSRRLRLDSVVAIILVITGLLILLYVFVLVERDLMSKTAPLCSSYYPGRGGDIYSILWCIVALAGYMGGASIASWIGVSILAKGLELLRPSQAHGGDS